MYPPARARTARTPWKASRARDSPSGMPDVVHSDAVKLLQTFPDDSVAMIFADPPYGIGYHSNHYKDKNPHAPVHNDWNFNIGRFLRESARSLRVGGALYLCCRWDVSAIWQREVPPPLAVKNSIVWVKDNHSAGDLDGNFGNKYESILFIVKGRHHLRGKRWTNVWEFPRVPHTAMLHPTQKPQALVERAILASSDATDFVVDPFSGSGTTAVAALATGRGFVVGDIDPAMVRLTRKRLGWEVEEAPEVAAAPIDYEEQVEHNFGAAADDLAEIAAALRAGGSRPG